MLIFSFLLLLKSSPVFALEAMNPVSLCSRMIHTSEKKECEEQAVKLKLDWYAATACNALSDDKVFMSCWHEIAGAEFNPDSLSRCVENPDDNDESILKCILLLKNNRLPASLRRPYQPLKIKNQI